MRLENRKAELIKETEDSKIYKLICSNEEAIRLREFIVSEVPLVEWKKNKIGKLQNWVFNCYAENVGAGMTFYPGEENEITSWDEHLTFIIPEYWKEKGLQEGFYEAGKYDNCPESLAYYVRRLATKTEKEKDYCAQYMASNGDPEYDYLKAICDIEDALCWREELIHDNSVEAKNTLEMMLPLGVKREITVEIPNSTNIFI